MRALGEVSASLPAVARRDLPQCPLPSPPIDPTQLVPQPGSVTWRYASDARLLSTGAYAILLQVAHPTVGAGVSEHSEFRADPWGRLLRTLDYVYAMTYGGAELAGETARQIREMHKRIKGVRPDGERYHALEPGAYAWVHATLVHSIVRGHKLLGKPMSSTEIECLYAEWRRSGELIGVRERDLPEGWTAFRAYFDEMVAERLERTPAVEEVLEALGDPVGPELNFLPQSAWCVARVPAVHQIELVTGGLLGQDLRERLGVPWSRSKERELRVLATASRAMTPLLPPTLRSVGPRYLRWRGLDRALQAA
jgi:uncharacterized protein (DUF2236 family)